MCICDFVSYIALCFVCHCYICCQWCQSYLCVTWWKVALVLSSANMVIHSLCGITSGWPVALGQKGQLRSHGLIDRIYRVLAFVRKVAYSHVPYNMVQYNDIAYITAVTGAEYRLNLHKTNCTLPYPASYSVSFVTIFDKIEHVIKVPHCIRWNREAMVMHICGSKQAIIDLVNRLASVLHQALT